MGEQDDADVEELRATKAFYEALLSAAPVGIWHSAPDGCGSYFNPKLAEIAGLTMEQAAGDRWASAVHPEDRERVVARWMEAVAQGGEFSSFHRFVTDAGVRHTIAQAVPARTDDGKTIGYVGTLTDVTERKRAEEALLHDQRLRAIGTLAAGIAHAFNNLLAVVQGNASDALAALPPDDGLRAQLQDIVAAVRIGASLTEQLMSFAGHDESQRRRVDVEDLIRESCEAFSGTRQGATVALRLTGSGAAVDADPLQFRQLLMSLLLNASESSDGEAPIVVSTALGERGITLCVTDAGVGMTPEIVERAREPFFTTKGQGRGLGLAVAHGIVERHGGSLRIESQPGLGTNVRVSLPTVTDQPQVGDGLRGEAILVIDDDAAVLRSTARMLERRGYDVVQASSGSEGLEIAGARAFDLVILDMIMPGMSGAATFERIRGDHPQLPVLIMTGYSTDAQMRDLLTRPRVTIVRKPVGTDELAKAVGDALSG